ncbi:polynucleotide kinase-phosphatase [Actinoallomurus vinaceus]|uniref:Polynucleotide kinase-phosphatase n=1 Tax=Actinoallomurus vinaceus TaxID=1080074 RepID=A0ABP8UDV4_9ACTN
MTELKIPEMALVVLVGVSGSGKSYFARRHFAPTQVVSSDHCRAVVSDDENDQSATADAFDLLHHIVRTRLRRGLLTVVDATNVQPRPREQLVRIAKEHDVLAVAIVLDVPESVAIERNAARTDRDLPDHVVPRQRRELRRGLRALDREFRRAYVLRGEEIDQAVVTYDKSWSDRRHLTGPFDLIGDVHGCRAELEDLLASLGYAVERDPLGRAVGAAHPEGRTAVFLGDLVDRGPDTPGVLRLAMGMVAAGTALCVPGNHENKLVRALKGRRVTVGHGLAESLDQLANEPEEFRAEALAFMDGLVSHLVLDEGRLVVAHAGLKEAYQGRASGRVRSFALYGETTGETDEYGLPVRYPWANDYRGAAMVVYGHTPVPEPEWINNTLCVDTGCVFGGRLTALRYPEKEIVSVPARQVWYEPVRPLVPETAPGTHRESGVLRVTDIGEAVETRLMGRVSVREENVWPALEVMSRFAVDPRWLVYLPPTMAPAPTSALDGFLEHPAEAFEAYRRQGVARVVCEEKHMGSRAIVVVTRDAETAAGRFGVDDGTTGAVYTRTGRSFFPDPATTEEFLERVRTAAGGLFEELQTGWLVLDCELMPWSAKAVELLRTQYAATGAAARAALPMAVDVLDRAAARGLDVGALRDRVARRSANADLFRDAYARYCWPTEGLKGLRLAPFQVLAAEGRSYAERDHLWHLATADRLAAADGELFAPTRSYVLDLSGDESAAIAWWTELTAAGGEGMVVKPMPPDGNAGPVPTTRGGHGGPVPAGRGGHGGAEPAGWDVDGGPAPAGPDGGRRLVQPGLKCRGREYLRIIYGPDYTEPEHLERLRKRSLGRKRSLAMREYALGLEALDRLAAGEPLWRVHQAVFGVLALESEPVDPRL